MAETYDYKFKLLLIGDSDVGKTAMLRTFVEGFFTPYTFPTLGM